MCLLHCSIVNSCFSFIESDTRRRKVWNNPCRILHIYIDIERELERAGQVFLGGGARQRIFSGAVVEEEEQWTNQKGRNFVCAKECTATVSLLRPLSAQIGLWWCIWWVVLHTTSPTNTIISTRLCAMHGRWCGWLNRLIAIHLAILFVIRRGGYLHHHLHRLLI